MLLVCGCNGLLDVPGDGDLASDLKDRVDDLEKRVSALEKLCAEINSNLASLKTIVEAVQTGDYITKVDPIVADGVEIGYTITFAKGGTINIYHGQKGDKGDPGKDGSYDNVPQIGLRQDTDGLWYWTLNGEWLLDEQGQKVCALGRDGAAGADGKDGVTPVLRINEDGYWEVSMDNGATWQTLGKAVGEQGPQGEPGEPGAPGKDGGDSIFSSVTLEGEYIVIVTRDGDSYRVPVQAELDIVFDVEQGFGLMMDAVTKISYTVIGGDENTLVRTVGVIEYGIYSVVKPVDSKTGYIYIYSEYNSIDGDDDIFNDNMDGVTYGDVIASNLAIIVSVSDGKNNSIMKSLNFEMGVLKSVSPAYLAEAEACSISVKVRTNTRYEVSCDAEWLSQMSTKAIREDELTFAVKANESGEMRTALVRLVNHADQTLESFAIAQKAKGAGNYIEFADPAMEALCVGRWDTNSDGKLSILEALAVTDVSGLFDNNKSVTSFDEFKYFVAVKKLPKEFAKECASLVSITLPKAITDIPENCFYGCTSLARVTIQTPVESVGSYAFAYCSCLESMDLSNVKTLSDYYANDGVFAFSGISSIILSDELTTIPARFFQGCKNLKSIVFPSALRNIGHEAFEDSGLEGEWVEAIQAKAFVIPESVNTLGYGAFRGCAFDKVVAYQETPVYGYGTFDEDMIICVPDEIYDNYAGIGYYTVLPFSLGSISLTAECKVALFYWVTDCTIYLDCTVSQKNFPESLSGEKGIYLKTANGNDLMEIPVEPFGQTFRVRLESGAAEELFRISRENSLLAGAYVRLESGQELRFDEQEVSFLLEPEQREGYIKVGENYAQSKESDYFYLPVSTDPARFYFISMNGVEGYAIVDQYGQLLYSDGVHAAFQVDGIPAGDNHLWTITEVEGGMEIKNKGTGMIVAYVPKYGTVGHYSVVPEEAIYPVVEWCL